MRVYSLNRAAGSNPSQERITASLGRKFEKQFGRFGYVETRTTKWSSEYKTTIYRSISEVPPKVWDSIIGSNSLLRSHAYLCAIESASIDGYDYFYVLVHDRFDRLVGHACVYTVDTNLAQLLPRSLDKVVATVRKFWKKFGQVKITECAAPLATTHSISISHAAIANDVVDEITVAIKTISKTQGSRLIVIRDFLGDERLCFDRFLERGFNLVSNMPLARIRVRWKTYQDYISDMRSRYRKDVKRRLRRAARAGQTISLVDRFARESDLWATQAKTVQEKSKGFKREVLPAAYYEAMDRFLCERSKLVTAIRNEKFVAHGMLLLDDDSTIATFFGRDPGPAHHEWFHLVNEVIRIGIESNSAYINLGLGSYDAKSNVGADLEPLFVYAQSTIPGLNFIMRLMPRKMDQSPRNPKVIFRSEELS